MFTSLTAGSWSEARIADLKRVWAAGLSASQNAEALGGVSRNAVIGKIHRLGLARRAMPARPSTATRRPTTPPAGPA